MAHEVRFCAGPDGTGLAYAVHGRGPVLLKASNWLTHLEYELESPVWRHWVVELGRGHTLVRYDERGCGLSDREFDGVPTLDTFVGDLGAVVDAAGFEQFVLLGISGGGPTAIAYAAANPERVQALVLYGTYARGRFRRDESQREQSAALIELMRVGWGGADPAFRSLFSSLYLPGAGEEQKRWYDELQQVSSSGEMAARLWLARTEVDVAASAARLAQPTLVLHARGDGAVPYEEGRLLASLIPNARFVSLDSRNHILQADEPAWEEFLAELRDFTGAASQAGDDTVGGELADLSARERDVLRLVAQGLSNEEIADQLVLSVRTVERHLSNVYAKLRISGKAARAAAAARFASMSGRG